MTITKGISKPKAIRGIIHGVEGIGKTTLASKLPGVLFLDVEDGTHGIDVAKIDDVDCTQAVVLGLMNELITNPPDGVKTLVIDTADKLEAEIIAELCREKGKPSIEEVAAYGKGYTYLKERMARILDKASDVVASGISVFFIAHTALKKQELPDQSGSFDRYELKLTKQCAPIFKEWADLMLFVNYKTNIVEGEDGRKRGQGGKRMVYSVHKTTYDAKCRTFIDLPETASLDDMQTLLPEAITKACDNSAAPKKPQPKPAPKAEPKPAPKREPKASDFDSAELDPEPETRPLVIDLRKLMGQYSLTDEDVINYSKPRLVSRYGDKDWTVATLPDAYITWFNKNIDKIAPKIKESK